MTWPAILLWVLIAYGAVSRGPSIIYLFSISTIFGDLTLLPLSFTGGFNLPAQTVCAVVLITKTILPLRGRNAFMNMALDMRRLGILSIFSIYAILTAFLLPRLFAGDVMVYSLNAAGSESPLHPTSANFSQPVYLMISVLMLFSFAIRAKDHEFLKTYIRSILVAAVLLAVSGVMDLALNDVGLSALLAPVHNGGYNLLAGATIAGQTRVTGFMSEASVFGEACCCTLSFLMFNFSYFEQRMRVAVVLPLIFILFTLTFLSTSSTGYVGLIAILSIQALRSVMAFLFVGERHRISVRRLAILIGASLLVVGVSVSVYQSQLAHYQQLLNAVLFQKTASDSYIERTSWTAAGMAAFLATHGIGVGIGSVRTSNWFVNILASTGVIGVGLIILLVLSIIWPSQKRISNENQRLTSGLKWCLIPVAVMISLSGTTPDPGVWITTILGLLYALKSEVDVPAKEIRNSRALNHAL